MNRDLRPFPLEQALDFVARRECVITMSIGQWDQLLAMAYDAGWILLELDDDERPLRAYRKSAPSAPAAADPLKEPTP